MQKSLREHGRALVIIKQKQGDRLPHSSLKEALVAVTVASAGFLKRPGTQKALQPQLAGQQGQEQNAAGTKLAVLVVSEIRCVPLSAHGGTLQM